MKYLLVLAVVMVAIYVWRNNRISDRSDTSRQPPAPPAPPGASRLPVVMVACGQCGIHLPLGDAVEGSLGPYCSGDHRRLKEGGSA